MKAAGFALLVAMGGVANAAAAADKPLLIPSRDVSVTYRTAQGGQVLEQRMRWSAQARRMRIDPPSAGMFVIIDYDARRIAIVRDPDRSVVEMDAPPTLPGLGAPAAGHYSPGASDLVAGLRCMEWTIAAAAGPPTSICVTSDGVVLRVRIGGRVAATASDVTYGVQDAKLFRIPEGYARVTPPR